VLHNGAVSRQTPFVGFHVNFPDAELSDLRRRIMIPRVTITSQNFLPAAPMAPSREKRFSIASRSIGG
jgi:hypothetical protein